MRKCNGTPHKGKLCESNQDDSPDTVIALLKECAKSKDLYKGIQVHNHIIKSVLLQDNVFVNNTLVSMYAKCGMVLKAQAVFDDLPFHDMVSWNALIAGYAQCGNFYEASRCLERLKLHGFIPNAITLVCMLKACGKIESLPKGQMIHAHIVGDKSLETNEFIGSGLVDMYGKCGLLSRSEEAFNRLSMYTLVSWNVLISGYAHHGCNEFALSSLECMKARSFLPDEFTITCILKACGSIGALEKGQEIHARIVEHSMLGKDCLIGNALVDMYAKCGAPAKARGVFETLPFRDVVSYNALIWGFCQQGHGDEAMKCFEEMKSEGFSPSSITFLCLLRACASIQALTRGREMHVQIGGLLMKDVVLGNALVDMYCKCGSLEKAQEVFDEIQTRNIVTWNALIAGYEQHGQSEDVLNCLEQMRLGGFSPDVITFVCSLKACGTVGDLGKGQEIHAEIVNNEFFKGNIVIGNSLIDMYARCGELMKAQEVFDDLQTPNVTSWNVLISGYVQYGCYDQAWNCFHRMQSAGLSPDAITFVCILKACGSMESIEKGQEIHFEIARQGLMTENDIIATALVDMYAKCGAFTKAYEVFNKIPVQNAFSWNVLIARNAQYGYCKEVLNCFEQMQRGGICPNMITFLCVLKTCGNLGTIVKGQEIHIKIVKEGLAIEGILIGNALVDMYANCGALDEAQIVFENLSCRDQISWTSLMGGYAQLGEEEMVFKSFRELTKEGQAPDAVAFTLLLNACSHKGLLEKGESLYFWMADKSYGITPTLEQCSCIVDLFGRAGQLEKSRAVIEGMPFDDDVRVWLILLGACHKWGNVSLGKLAFEHAIELDEHNARAYVYMSNIYASNGRQDNTKCKVQDF